MNNDWMIDDRERYRAIFEWLQIEWEHADYPEALRCYRIEYPVIRAC